MSQESGNRSGRGKHGSRAGRMKSGDRGSKETSSKATARQQPAVREPGFVDIVSQAINHFNEDYLESLSQQSSRKDEFVTKPEFDKAVQENAQLKQIYKPLKEQITRAIGAKKSLKGEYVRTKNHFSDVDQVNTITNTQIKRKNET